VTLLKSYAKLNYSSKNAVLIVASCIAIIAFYNHFVAPHRNYLRAEQTYGTLVGAIDRKNRLIAGHLKTKKQELQQLQQKSQMIHATLFDEAKAKQFYSSIQTAAEQTNCVVDSLRFPQARKQDKMSSPQGSYVSASRMILNVTGGYRNIVALINKLQNRPEQVWIDSLSIKTARGGVLKCDMTVTIYVIYNEEGPTDA
jgi:hypothetical protein